MDKFEWLYDVFAFIGMAVCIIISLIAIVWITCFAVKLLIKVFNVKVVKSYDILVEDINKKSEARKERNEMKRNEKARKKKEILNLKLESKNRIYEMKKKKLAENLNNKEEKARVSIFGEDAGVVENKLENENVEGNNENCNNEELIEEKINKKSKSKKNSVKN